MNTKSKEGAVDKVCTEKLLIVSSICYLTIYYHKVCKLHGAFDCVQILSAAPYLKVSV